MSLGLTHVSKLPASSPLIFTDGIVSDNNFPSSGLKSKAVHSKRGNVFYTASLVQCKQTHTGT